MLQYSNRLKHIITVILLTIFTVYYVDIGFFFHSHRIDGEIVSHSHFHNKHHTQTGTHSATELNLISELSSFVGFPSITPFFIVAILALLGILSCNNITSKVLRSHSVHFSLRAPPAIAL